MTQSADRAIRRAHLLDSVLQDITYAVRTLRRAPGFAFVAIITLALGIGANTAIFSVVNSVLLRPLPYDNPEDIVWIEEHQPEQGRTMSVAWPNFVDWKEQSSQLSHIAVYGSGPSTVLGSAQPFRSTVAQVTNDFWEIFGVQPIEGRVLNAEEHEANGEKAALIREDLWRSVYQSRPLDEIRLEVSGIQSRVVGVLPTTFNFPQNSQIWLRLEGGGESRTSHNYLSVGRLGPEVRLEVADAELDAIQARLVEGESDREFVASGVRLTTLHERITEDIRGSLLLLLGAAGLVLLVACTNLASTLLARGATRAREVAVRTALGAGRARVVRQLLTESLFLSAIGGISGLGVASLALRALTSAAPASVPRLDQVGLDPWVLLFTAVTVVGTAGLFGLFPAFAQTREEVGTTLRAGGRQNSGRSRSRAWTILVGAEIALAFLLLTGSGLLIRSFRAALQTDRGFRSESVMTASLSLSRARYPNAVDHRDFYQQLLASLETRPEVHAVGLTTRTPLMGAPNGRIQLDDDLSKHAVALYLNVSGGYFGVLGIDLIRGRTFDQRDREDSEHVAIVSEAFADQYWPNDNPIGHTITGGGMDSFWKSDRFARVVGVVKDTRYRSLEVAPVPAVYFPFTQRPQRLRFSATVVASTDQSDASALVTPMRQAIFDLDSDALPRFSGMDERVKQSLESRKFTMNLLAAFGALAFVLVMVGIYGVVSYTVARRTREMGIRLALGANPIDVQGLVQNAALRTVVAGALVGMMGSLGLTRTLESLLFGVEPIDGITLFGAGLLLITAGWLASMIPARRATRVDPMVTMQAE